MGAFLRRVLSRLSHRAGESEACVGLTGWTGSTTYTHHNQQGMLKAP